MIFLIEYDRPRGELVSMTTYDDAERTEAENARLRRELELHELAVHREVVLIQAESELALKETHRRYFEDIESLAGSASR